MTFRIGKYKDILIENPVATSCGVGGEFNLVLRDANGKFLYETGWFPNLITDFGLINLYTFDTYSNYFHIGDSNVAPAFTDTTLVSWLASSFTIAPGGSSPGNEGLPNYSWYSIQGMRFNAGVGTGTIREVGMSNGASNTNMVIRALVTPEITKAADQVLDVYYRFRIYPNLVDATGQVTVDGELYDWTQRWSNIDTADEAFRNLRFSTGISVLAYPTSIGTITGTPGGTYEILNQFVANQYYDPHGCTGSITIPLDKGNVYGDTVDGITSLSARTNFGGNEGIQTEFSRVSDGKGLFKNNTQTMYVEWRLTWARH